MTLTFLKPITPSQRQLIKLNKKHLQKKPIIKTKILNIKKNSGRNFSGKITSRHRGNGHKRKYRNIDFSRRIGTIGIVVSIEYDPNRSSNIASIYNFTKNNFSYILAPKGLEIGNIVESGVSAKLYTGNALPLLKIPEGSFVYNVEYKKNQKAKLSRSAGTFSIVKEKTIKGVKLILSSKKKVLVPSQNYATLGTVSNEFYFLTQLGKAGRSRWLNWRPKVRGVAMNPIDHPHGGGEGKKSGKKFTLWGKPKKKLK